MISSGIFRARRLVGRARECAFFEERALAAVRGRGSVVVLTGAAGLGKTRLLRAWRAIAESHGFAVAATENYALARSPYAPIVDVVAPLITREPRAMPTAPRERSLLEGFLASTIPEDHGSAAQPSERRRLLAIVGRTLERIASIGPLAIFIDDAQWMDAESLEAVRYLAGPCSGQRAVIVLSARAEAEDRSATFEEALAALDRSECVHHVQLAPLEEKHVRELIVETAPLAERISRRTSLAILWLAEGNPLFVEDLVRDALARPNSRDLLPQSMEQSVRRRMKTLADADAAYLELAAASGATFEMRMLLELTGEPESTIHAMLRRARDLDLIAVDHDLADSFRFRHELTRIAVYAASLPSARIDMHRRIAMWIEGAGRANAPHAMLAWHWLQAGDLSRASHYAERAADDASRIFAYASAREYFELALSDAALATERRVSLETKLGNVALALGDPADAVKHFSYVLESAKPLGDAASTYRALLGLRAAKYRLSDFEVALRLADEAAAMVDPTEPAAFECFSAAAITAVVFYLDSQRKSEQNAAKVSRYIARARDVAQPDDVRSELRLLYVEAQLAVFQEDVELAREKSSACALVARSTENLLTRSVGLNYAIWIARELADFASMRPLIREYVAVAEECGDSYVAIESRIFDAQASYYLGEIAEARESMSSAFAHTITSPNLRMHAAACGIPIALATDDLSLIDRVAATDLLDALLAAKKPLTDLQQIFVSTHIDLAASRGDGERLAVLLNVAMENVAQLADCHVMAVSLARYIDDARLDLIAERLRAENGPVGFAAICRSLTRATIAQRRGTPDARRFCDVAVAIAQRAQSPTLVALAHEVGGNVRDACDAYRAIGALGHVRRLEPKAASATRAMSRREREIAEHVGRGLSNRAIGELLSISERTVEHHIASLFHKLGLRSRAELMAYVIRSTSPGVASAAN